MTDIRRIPGTGLTPEKIVSTLFNFHNKAHFYHLQTDTIGKHLLLDELYKALVEFKDEIAEYLLGVQVPKRFGPLTMEQIQPYSDANMLSFLNEGFDFSVELCSYAESKNEEELCNMASDLQKAFNKARLFTTYK